MKALQEAHIEIREEWIVQVTSSRSPAIRRCTKSCRKTAADRGILRR